MRVLMTGATGAVGRALARQLRREGHDVVAAVRDVARSRSVLGPEVERVRISDDAAMQAAVEAADAVVNLAGEGIADRRWSDARKQALWNSRVAVTERLAEQVLRAKRPPRVFVSASGIAYYAPHESAILDESSPAGDGFLAQLSQHWEAAAERVSDGGTRVVCLRIGVVLDSEAGALQKLLPPFRLGLGGRLGSGQQYMSWIHLDDLLGLVRHCLMNDGVRGAVNAVAPEPVTNREWTHALGQALGRPTPFPLPAFALRLGLGERANMLLDSLRAVPAHALQSGYRFLYPRITDAFGEILARQRQGTRIERLPRGAACPAPVRASHVLTQETFLDAPLDEVFAFFSKAENLGWITPPWMGFAIESTPAQITEGAEIRYRIALGPLPLAWKTRIAVWKPGERFVDNQERGPYRLWWHEHTFEAVGERTRMVDRVYYRAPLGRLGDWVAGAVIRSTLRRIFGYRAQSMDHRFGGRAPALPSGERDAILAAE